MIYMHTTVTQWPGDKDITPEIHEAIWDWQQKVNYKPGEDMQDLALLLAEAAEIFDKIGTRESPAMVAKRCEISIDGARILIQDTADRKAALQAKKRRRGGGS